MRVKRINRGGVQDAERRRFRGTLLLISVLVAVMVTAGALTFFLSVEGEEQTLVPDVTGEDVLTALSLLQEKALVPNVEARFSSDAPRWSVMDQNPDPGAQVRVGRPVNLIVSRGPVIDRVEDYVGRTIDEVRLELQTLFASYRSLVKVTESAPRVIDPTPSGTILAQEPPEGTPITDEVEITFFVSRGPRGDLITVANHVGRPFQDVLQDLAAQNLPFLFTVRAQAGNLKPGNVVSQSPSAGTEMPRSTILQLGMVRPTELEEGQVFGLFQVEIPQYPVLVDLVLTTETLGEATELLRMKHQGGHLAVPILVPADSEVVLWVIDEERMRVPAAALTL